MPQLPPAPEEVIVPDAMKATTSTAESVEPPAPVPTFAERSAEVDAFGAQMPGAAETSFVPARPWQGIVDNGLGMFKALVDAANAPVHTSDESTLSPPTAAPFSSSTSTDAATGQIFLKIALPPPEQLQRLLGDIAEMLATLSAKNKP